MSITKRLVIGASGQIGTELTVVLRQRYGATTVIAADLRQPDQRQAGAGLFEMLDVLDEKRLRMVIGKHEISEVYLLAATLSATGEQNPCAAWQLNMQSLIYLLELAREGIFKKLFWPGSIAVFGPSAPRYHCGQAAVQDPATMYGISKMAGEHWCRYYHQQYGVDVRSLRLPGLVSHLAAPGRGTTDYAVEIYHAALKDKKYTCYLAADTYLPMMYMPDAVRAILQLMEAPADQITIRTSYNISAVSFAPQEIARQIGKYVPGFRIKYAPDFRQKIAESWPVSLDDRTARRDWGWEPAHNLETMTRDMLRHLQAQYSIQPFKMNFNAN